VNLQKQIISLPHCNLTSFFVLQNDGKFGAKIKNHAQLHGLIAKLIEEVLVSLEASEPAKTNRVLFQPRHNAAKQLGHLSKIPPEIKKKKHRRISKQETPVFLS
jgi:hypothetical protein